MESAMSPRRLRAIEAKGLGLLLLNLVGADFPVPTAHRIAQLLDAKRRRHFPLGADLIVFRAPEFFAVILDIFRSRHDCRRLDPLPDERAPREDLLLRRPHELHHSY